ncbi:MAG: hypothetical protein NTX44_08560 [Ignavibacteriales bacterium]|nr:hypothetical protein [Ignavibacteriales bacterium]
MTANQYFLQPPNGWRLSPTRYYISGRDRDPAWRDRTAAPYLRAVGTSACTSFQRTSRQAGDDFCARGACAFGAQNIQNEPSSFTSLSIKHKTSTSHA